MKFIQNAHRKAISHGKNLSPAHLKTYKKAERKGAPIAAVNNWLLTRSLTKRLGVVLLKPCFSSRTKVWYRENGIDWTVEMRTSIPAKMLDCRIYHKLDL